MIRATFRKQNSKVSEMNITVVFYLFIVQHATLVIIVLVFFMQETHLKWSFVRTYIYQLTNLDNNE